MNENRIGVAEHKHLLPLEKIKGYDVRPGFYGINGATALQSVLWKQQMWSSFCITEEKENPMQSCRFRSITGSEGFIPCLYSDWISMILNMHIE